MQVGHASISLGKVYKTNFKKALGDARLNGSLENSKVSQLNRIKIICFGLNTKFGSLNKVRYHRVWLLMNLCVMLVTFLHPWYFIYDLESETIIEQLKGGYL